MCWTAALRMLGASCQLDEHAISDAIVNRATGALAARAWADFRVARRQTLVFHLLMQLLGLLLFAPLIGWVGDQIVSATGEPVIGNYDIAVFVLSPAGAAFVLIGAALVTGLLLAEFAGHSWIAGHAIARRPVTVVSTVAFVLTPSAPVDRAFHSRIPAARRAAAAVPRGRRNRVVHDARRAGHQLLPRREPGRVAAREIDRRRGGTRLRPARGVATHTLGVRRARPRIREG